MTESKQLFFETRAELREWFSKNHARAPSFDMVFYKKHTGKTCITYTEAVEEALCFGWIDQ